MRQFQLPTTGRYEAWREQARNCARSGIDPAEISWETSLPKGGQQVGLFEESPRFSARDDIHESHRKRASAENGASELNVPKAFVDLARIVIAADTPKAPSVLYRLLLRLQEDRSLLKNRSDPDVHVARGLEKSVRRDIHKMKAFVRFREFEPETTKRIQQTSRRKFFAWFEPDHLIVHLAAPFFARRFADMDWVIATPRVTAMHENGKLSLKAIELERPSGADPTEDLWRIYYRNIFNPARLKVKAMCAEMPRKYWKNLPEAELIPELIAGSRSQSVSMASANPTIPHNGSTRITNRLRNERCVEEIKMGERIGLERLRLEAASCERCELCRHATQTVFGEGPAGSSLMIVGEQPGDQEDIAGRPFVGPAGRLFDRVAEATGLDRSSVYVTNAVKHFKFTPRGKRRIHQRPNSGEIQRCRWWLQMELETVSPKLVIAMGATALEALTGNGKQILKRRSSLETAFDGTPVFITVHPSFLLRLTNEAEKTVEEARFAADLAAALHILDRSI